MFPYTGSKKNDIKYIVPYLPINIQKMTIVEPFGGSAALSYYLMNHYDNLYIHINDIDKNTYKMYKIIQNNKQKHFVNNMSKIVNKFKEPKTKKQTENIINKLRSLNSPESMYILRQIQFRPNSKTIRYGRITQYKNRIKSGNITILKTIIPNDVTLTVTNDDYKKILIKYINNQKTFLFLDPPYLIDRNDINDIYDILTFNDEDFIYIRNWLKKCKCYVMIVVLDSAFMRLCFEGYVKHEYEKIYQLTKKKVKHLIITNY